MRFDVLLQVGAAGCALGQRERFSLFGRAGPAQIRPKIREDPKTPIETACEACHDCWS
jgi:hypothetical protein